MNDADKRAQPRAQYFLIKDDNEAVPIYAFRAEDDVKAIPALVVDISEGGVQVLTTNAAQVSQQAYQLEVVTASPTTSTMERAHIEKVWSREDGVNVRTGFAFAPGDSIGTEWNAILQQAPHHLLRCVLHPVA